MVPCPFHEYLLPAQPRVCNARRGGVDAALTAALKVMADDTCLTMVTPNPIAEVLLRTNKVIVLDSRTLQASPQSRLTPLHPRVPMLLVLPRRLPPCDIALRLRVTLTRTLGTQARSRYNLLLPRDGPKTVPSPYHCLRHHITDPPPQLTPTHRKHMLTQHCNRALSTMPPTLPPRPELTP